MQNFSQIGEVPWPTLTQILQNMPLKSASKVETLLLSKNLTYENLFQRHFNENGNGTGNSWAGLLNGTFTVTTIFHFAACFFFFLFRLLF